MFIFELDIVLSQTGKGEGKEKKKRAGLGAAFPDIYMTFCRNNDPHKTFQKQTPAKYVKFPGTPVERSNASGYRAITYGPRRLHYVSLNTEGKEYVTSTEEDGLNNMGKDGMDFSHWESHLTSVGIERWVCI